jgi:hypothetical protein
MDTPGRRWPARRDTTSQHGPCRPQTIDCCACWSTSSSIPRHCSMGACSGGASLSPRTGIMSYARVAGHAAYRGGCVPRRRVEALRAPPGVAESPRPLEASPTEEVRAAPSPVNPLLVMTAPSAASRAPTTRRNRTHTIVQATAAPAEQPAADRHGVAHSLPE